VPAEERAQHAEGLSLLRDTLYLKVTIAWANESLAWMQVSSFVDATYAAFDADVTPAVLPIYWAEEVGEASETNARDVRELFRVRCCPWSTLPYGTSCCACRGASD
jgi:hypothetical protein